MLCRAYLIYFSCKVDKLLLWFASPQSHYDILEQNSEKFPGLRPQLLVIALESYLGALRLSVFVSKIIIILSISPAIYENTIKYLKYLSQWLACSRLCFTLLINN